MVIATAIGGQVLLAVVVALALALLMRDPTWPACFSATLDDGWLHYRQLSGTRDVRLADVRVITKRTWGEGNTPAFTIHHASGRAIVFGAKGAAFTKAVTQADPRIQVTPARGWLWKLRHRGENSAPRSVDDSPRGE